MKNKVHQTDSQAGNHIVDKGVSRAQKLFTEGKVEEAEEEVRKVLGRDKNNCDSLYLLGMINFHRQQWMEAIELINRAILVDPKRVKYYGNLGEAQLVLGQFKEAITSYQVLLSKEPENALVLFNLGRSYVLSGDKTGAIGYLERAIKAAPNFLEARRALGSLFLERGNANAAVAQYEEILRQTSGDFESIANLGVALTQADRIDEAVELLAKAQIEQPDNVRIISNLALALVAANREEEGLSWLNEALSLEPENPGLLNNLGNLARRLGQFEAAERHLRQAIMLRNDYAEARNNLSLVFFDQGQYEEAEDEIMQALALAPNAVRAMNNLGLVQQYTNRMNEGVESFKKALELDPSYLEAQTNLATIYSWVGRVGEAVTIFDEVLIKRPSSLTAFWNRCNAILLSGDYGRGWDDYERRWEVNDYAPRAFTQKQWKEEDLKNHSILVYGEQGPGDVIMFAHCLGDLVAGAKNVSVQVDPRLVSLMERSFSSCRVESEKTDNGTWALADTEFVVPIGSLPRHFRRREEDFSRVRGRYLVPDSEAVEKWNERYSRLGAGPTIGISWRGGVNSLERSRRVMKLNDWAGLLTGVRLNVVNLQHGDCSEEITAFMENHNIKVHNWENTGVDLDDYAAQIDALDLVLSVANTTVHFAGALDKKTWVLAPTQPSWRWQIDRDDSPWYRSVRIFRQNQNQLWKNVLDGLSDELAQLVIELEG